MGSTTQPAGVHTELTNMTDPRGTTHMCRNGRWRISTGRQQLSQQRRGCSGLQPHLSCTTMGLFRSGGSREYRLVGEGTLITSVLSLQQRGGSCAC